METKTEFDFSIRNVPDAWNDAAEEGPEGDAVPLRRKRVVGQIPHHYDLDLLTACLAGMSMAIVAGTSWYFLEIRNAVTTPWLAMVLGLLIAMAVRLGAGEHHAEVRATISVIFYIATIFTVAYMVERYQFVSLYGNDAVMAGSERGLVRDRLTEPVTLAAWSIGVLVTMQASYLLRKR